MNFQRYLISKKSIDDRAINRNVFEIFSKYISHGKKHSILELGGGVGTMVQRLSQWLPRFDLDYTLMDVDPDNIKMAKEIIGTNASNITKGRQSGYNSNGDSRQKKQLRVEYLEADIYDLNSKENASFDGIIANAFFDLVDTETVFPILRKLLKPGGWIYATINFDGQTIFEPLIDELLDSKIVDAYHASMTHTGNNGRIMNGSHTGRKLFSVFQSHEFAVKAIGSSDWVVFPNKNLYSADEKYFMESILFFVQDSVKPSDLISEKEINSWLEIRKAQLDKGQLFFIAHQLDYFAIKLS